MTLDQMAQKVGIARYTQLAIKAQQIANSENRSPEVDQGGQYVWIDAGWELRKLLEKEMVKM